jgi:toxin ParE1/3/4
MKGPTKVILLPVAEDDLTEIIDYVIQDKPSAAVGLLDRFQKNFNLLKENPLLGKVAQEENLSQLGYRYIIVSSYLIFYVIEESTVEIHRILHSARDYGRILS